MSSAGQRSIVKHHIVDCIPRQQWQFMDIFKAMIVLLWEPYINVCIINILLLYVPLGSVTRTPMHEVNSEDISEEHFT